MVLGVELHVILLMCRILRWMLDFCKIYATLTYGTLFSIVVSSVV